MVGILRPEPDAGAVVQPKAAAFWLPGWNLQPLASPDPLDPLVIDKPAGPTQQLSDLTISIPAVEPGQFDDVGRQPVLVIATPRDLALCRAMLAERRTGATLGNAKFSSNMLDTGTATRGAQ